MDKWPRQYAQEILAAPNREARVNLLSEVPEHLRDWVEYSVRDSYDRRKFAVDADNADRG